MATQRRNALGRGLDALLSMEEVKTEGSSSINEIELSKISVNPNQPRREFDETALEELADSIREIGIIQPITRLLPENAATAPLRKPDWILFPHISGQPMMRT